MRKLIFIMMIAGTGLSGIATAEPRQRLHPANSEVEQVDPSSPKEAEPGESLKGPHAYGQPSTEEGRERLGNSNTPGVPESGDSSYTHAE